MAARLCIHVPDDAALLRIVDDDADLVLGREADCDIVVAHESVSRRHARLRRDGQAWLLLDLGSKNGTRVHGERIVESRLLGNDWFAMGDVFCELQPIDDAQRERLEARALERRHASAVWSTRLDATPDETQLIGTLMKGIVELAECQRGFFLMPDAAGQLRVRACYGLSPDELAATTFCGSDSAVERAIADRRPVFLSDRRDRAWLTDRASVVAQGIQALVCLPLEQDGELLGVAYADTADVAKEFTQLDAQLLTAFGDHAAATLAVSKLGSTLATMSSWFAVSDTGVAQTRSAAPAWKDVARRRTLGVPP
jgi:GAF domain-containing protein